MGRERKEVLAPSKKGKASVVSLARLGKHTKCLMSEWSVHRNVWNPRHFCRSLKGREHALKCSGSQGGVTCSKVTILCFGVVVAKVFLGS